MLDILNSPITHIINGGIENRLFQKAWSLNKISPIPKVDHPVKNDEYRPVSVLFVVIENI